MKIVLNWELEINHVYCPQIFSRGRFCVTKNGDIIIGYNQESQNNLHEKGKIVRIIQGKIQDIFETNEHVRLPVLDENENIYFTYSDRFFGMVGKTSKSTLVKIDHNNALIWEFPLKSQAQTVPVLDRDSLFLFDFTANEKHGWLSKINLDGKLIWEKQFSGICWCEPLLLKNNQGIIIGFRFLKKMYLIDLSGKIMLEKTENGDGGIITFSQDGFGNIYGCPNGILIAYNKDLTEKWKYMVPEGYFFRAPVADDLGNLYICCGQRLISLEINGKEKWITKASGIEPGLPVVLGDGKILNTSCTQTSKKTETPNFITYLDIFTSNGEKVTTYELSGTIIYSTLYHYHTIYAATEITHYSEDHFIRNIKIYSLTIV
jgi:hypothetical protein